MALRKLLFGGVLLVVVAGLAGLAVVVVRDGAVSEGLADPHNALPLAFEPPVQPDEVGPVRVRFNCPERPGQGAVTVKVLYAGHPNEAGRPYANETFEILLDPVHATGRQGEVIVVPAKAMDRRVRDLVDKPFGADVHVTGQNDLSGHRYVLPEEDVSGVIEVSCRTS
ncbi:hypothetical protein [Brevundimonas sp. GCM10030266]|uniref:hypothetical protein n=1 Tax=Brevundimonas sp. GCM10030266 TaxID=3273386 RepID=UPI003615495B